MKPKYPIKAFDGTNTADVSVLNLPAGSVGANGEIDLGVGVKVYRALLTQTGTDAPVATVLENTLGGAVVWTYSDVGVYIGTLTGAFTANKVAASIPVATTGNDFVTGIVVVRRASDDTVLVKTAGVTDLTAGLDGVLNASPIQILVYP